jgi:oligosaccharide repeat unit polymerase
MIDLLLLTALATMAAALGVGWLRWRQTGVITPFGGFLVGSVFFVQLGFLYFYFVYEKAIFAQDALLTISLGILSATAGGLVGLFFLEPSPKKYQIPFQQVRWAYPFQVYIFVAIILLSLTVLYFVLLGYVPLLMGLETLLTEGFGPQLLQKPRTMRNIYINPDAAYIPLQGLLEAFRFVGLSMAAIWFVHRFREGKQRLLSVFMVAFCLFWLVSTGQRWPLLHFLINLSVYFSFTTSHYHFRRIASRIVLWGFVSGAVISALQARTNEVLIGLLEIAFFGVADLADRILFGNATAPVLSFQVFPYEYNWLWGQSYLQNLLCYLPGPYPSFPVTFNYMVMREQVGFTAPPDFYTEAYVNFGLIGTLIMSFLFGVLLAMLDKILLRYRDTVIGLSGISVVTTYAILTSTNSLIFNIGVLIVMGLVMICFLALKSINRSIPRLMLPLTKRSRQLDAS